MDAPLNFNRQSRDRLEREEVRENLFRLSELSSSSRDLFGASFRYSFLFSPVPLVLA